MELSEFDHAGSARAIDGPPFAGNAVDRLGSKSKNPSHPFEPARHDTWTFSKPSASRRARAVSASDATRSTV
jgi:hypothetical protein